MSKKRIFVDSLRDILNATEKAVSFIGELGFEDFKQDEKTVFAVVRALEIIGEAANHLPKTVQKNYPSIPWADIIGMRNIVIHEYFVSVQQTPPGISV